LEGDAIGSESYDFAGWRVESRYRLLEYDAFLNPVLYVEHENLRPDHKYLLDVTGRTDTVDASTATRHDIESKLILGPGHYRQLDVAFNWINETSLDSGRWEFGYAMGLNYVLYAAEDQRTRGEKGGPERSNAASYRRLKGIKVGVELYGV
jgi:hypothetical protein